MNRRKLHPLMHLAGWLVMLFLIGPVVIVLGTSVSDTTYLAFPPKGLTLRWFENVFAQDSFLSTFAISMQVAAGGTLLALMLGLAAAYALARYRTTIPAWYGSVFFLPFFIPEIVFGFSLLKTLIVLFELPVMPSLILGHAILCLPYMVRVIGASLASFDFSIKEAAVSLGMHPVRAFWTIVLPNIRSGMIAGVVLAFITSLNDMAVALFLTGPGISTLPIEVFTYVEQFFDPTVSAVSVLLMAVTTIVMILIERSLGLSQTIK
ncbi:ABC transporter permease [Neorhizobium sp. Rsf11]|uniref:ABC transporter permease n=2 Tax=Neorhizobium TaxID=1525371 RepID=A0ABV0MCZ1_9HYPH|nr:ABC transporter permease [Neorhizobium petrolearium]MCC2614141.1 ABC transporter permease [Neorhizobium petrolearium]WGI71653.1 ABC transporter permease [Neorhizobium petrolearium]